MASHYIQVFPAVCAQPEDGRNMLLMILTRVLISP